MAAQGSGCKNRTNVQAELRGFIYMIRDLLGLEKVVLSLLNREFFVLTYSEWCHGYQAPTKFENVHVCRVFRLDL